MDINNTVKNNKISITTAVINNQRELSIMLCIDKLQGSSSHWYFSILQILIPFEFIQPHYGNEVIFLQQVKLPAPGEFNDHW